MTRENQSIRIAVYQCAAAGLTLPQRLERLQKAIESHEQESSIKLDLVLCPELFLSGYNVGKSLESYTHQFPDHGISAVAELAKKSNIAITFGYPEKNNDKLYNAAACIDSSGTLLANHHKQLNSPHSFEEDYFTPGVTKTLFAFKGLKVALMICYEIEFPEAARAASIAGADLILVPTALVAAWDVVASKLIPTRAFENGVWLAYANHAGHENGFDYFGGSKIVAPNGEVVASANAEESIISTVVETTAVEKAQARLPYLKGYQKFLHETEI